MQEENQSSSSNFIQYQFYGTQDVFDVFQNFVIPKS